MVQQQIRERAHELSLLGSGLAHEVRNPLHALRLNLHIVRRAMTNRGSLAPEELLETIHHSDAAIERIEAVLRDLVQFVEPTVGRVVGIDLVGEVQAALSLLASDRKCDAIKVDISQCSQSAEIQVDAGRLRQAMLSLLSFVQFRAGKQGKIEIESSLSGEQIELSIAHRALPLSSDLVERLFEPFQFQAPLRSGTGLELALARLNIEAAGGSVRYEQSPPDISWLVLSFPTQNATVNGRTA